MCCFIHMYMDLQYAGCTTRKWCRNNRQVHCSYMHWYSYLELIATLKLKNDCLQTYNDTFIVGLKRVFCLRVIGMLLCYTPGFASWQLQCLQLPQDSRWAVHNSIQLNICQCSYSELFEILKVGRNCLHSCNYHEFTLFYTKATNALFYCIHVFAH